MELRIRSANDTTSRFLADIPFRPEAIDSVIPTLGAWGVVAEGGRMFAEGQLVGQFVDTGDKAYFEVICGLDD